MKLKDLMEQYGEYDIVFSKREATNEIMIEGRKPKQKTVWDLKDGDKYFTIYTDGEVALYEWSGSGLVDILRNQGNVFLTEEEAEKDVERRKVETLLLKFGGRRWYKDDSDTGEKLNWHICYGFDVCVGWGGPRQGSIYFDTKEQAQKAVDEIGEERIKKALFEVRE